jgi:DNA-binding MarR family transcriptional regulator
MGSPLLRYFDALVLHETRLWALVERRVRVSRGAVSLARFEVLRTVGAAEGGCRVQDVADALRITVGAASRIVDRLVKDAFLTRSPHPDDRRSVRLDLTGQGRLALDATGGAVDEALGTLLGGVDQNLIASLATALQEIDARLAAGAADR